MHNNSVVSLAPVRSPDDSPRPLIRAATPNDAGSIAELVGSYAAEGLMLPRTASRIAMNADNYIVAIESGRVVACAALEEYSPSLAEVSSVAVARSHHGSGLGTQVVLGVERLARARNIREVFALSLSQQFFLSLDYTTTSITNYPEKLARYESLIAAGIQIVPKPCFQKILGATWQAPQLMTRSATEGEPTRRAS